MKTTVEIQDELYARIQKKAQRDGRTVRSIIEEGLRLSLEAEQRAREQRYELPDESVGDPQAANPLESWSWAELRDEIYGGR